MPSSTRWPDDLRHEVRWPKLVLGRFHSPPSSILSKTKEKSILVVMVMEDYTFGSVPLVLKIMLANAQDDTWNQPYSQYYANIRGFCSKLNHVPRG